MALSRNQRTQLDNLLNAGKVAEAAALLAGVADPAAIKRAEAEAAAPPAPPRAPNEVILDLFKGVHQLLGNSPALVPLINELAEVLAPAAAEEQPAK